MILYVNGDSHSAACEAVNPSAFVYDYSKNVKISQLIRKIWQDEINWAPHPDNLQVSYGQLLANNLSAELHCHARSAGSNDRIIRTTKKYLQTYKPDIIVIGWSTWEREEWYNEDDDVWYQVNASGIDGVPPKWRQRYKRFVSNINWESKIIDAHQKIWDFHLLLKENSLPHLFFNCDLSFERIPKIGLKPYDWGNNYIHPYHSSFSYGKYLIQKGCGRNSNYHFGPDGHQKWAEFLLPHLTALL